MSWIEIKQEICWLSRCNSLPYLWVRHNMISIMMPTVDCFCIIHPTICKPSKLFPSTSSRAEATRTCSWVVVDIVNLEKSLENPCSNNNYEYNRFDGAPCPSKEILHVNRNGQRSGHYLCHTQCSGDRVIVGGDILDINVNFLSSRIGQFRPQSTFAWHHTMALKDEASE